MIYDYTVLRKKIIEKFGKNLAFAARLGVSEHTLSLKLNNKVEWRQSEILMAIKILGLNESDIVSYFFYIKSSKY